MFDLGTWGEILIIAVAALILIGPKELPTLLRGLGRLIQKFKTLSAGFHREFDRYIHEGEFEEYTKQSNIHGMMAMDENEELPLKKAKKPAKTPPVKRPKK